MAHADQRQISLFTYSLHDNRILKLKDRLEIERKRKKWSWRREQWWQHVRVFDRFNKVVDLKYEILDQQFPVRAVLQILPPGNLGQGGASGSSSSSSGAAVSAPATTSTQGNPHDSMESKKQIAVATAEFAIWEVSRACEAYETALTESPEFLEVQDELNAMGYSVRTVGGPYLIVRAKHATRVVTHVNRGVPALEGETVYRWTDLKPRHIILTAEFDGLIVRVLGRLLGKTRAAAKKVAVFSFPENEQVVDGGSLAAEVVDEQVVTEEFPASGSMATASAEPQPDLPRERRGRKRPSGDVALSPLDAQSPNQGNSFSLPRPPETQSSASSGPSSQSQATTSSSAHSQASTPSQAASVATALERCSLITDDSYR